MNDRPNEREFINTTYSHKLEGVLSAQKEGLNWLFTMNLGGLAGILTFASAKQTTPAVIWALATFSAGLLSLTFYGVRYYYYEEQMLNGFRSDVRQFQIER